MEKKDFVSWLKQQQGRDDPIGDLAEDISRDGTMPSALSSFDELEDHLLMSNAHMNAMSALSEARDEYARFCESLACDLNSIKS